MGFGLIRTSISPPLVPSLGSGGRREAAFFFKFVDPLSPSQGRRIIIFFERCLIFFTLFLVPRDPLRWVGVCRPDPPFFLTPLTLLAGDFPGIAVGDWKRGQLGASEKNVGEKSALPRGSRQALRSSEKDPHGCIKISGPWGGGGWGWVGGQGCVPPGGGRARGGRPGAHPAVHAGRPRQARPHCCLRPRARGPGGFPNGGTPPGKALPKVSPPGKAAGGRGSSRPAGRTSAQTPSAALESPSPQPLAVAQGLWGPCVGVPDRAHSKTTSVYTHHR